MALKDGGKDSDGSDDSEGPIELRHVRDVDGDVVGDTIEINTAFAPRTLNELRAAKAGKLGFRAKKMIITPQLAYNWLETRARNRDIIDDHVRRLAERMKTGWIDQPAGISFDNEGLLIDGQHRLWAIITADMAVEMMVYEGVDKAAMSTFDTGKSRNVAQALRIITGDKRSRRKAETVGVLYALEQNVASFRLDNADHAAKLIEKYKDAIDWVVYLSAGGKRQTSRLLPAAVRGALALAYHVHPRITKQFTDAMMKGAMLEEDSPEFILRHTIEAGKNRVTDIQRYALAGKVLRCIRAKMTGDALPKKLEATEAVNAYFQEALKKIEAGK